MTYLAMDIGASSGKLVRAELKEGRISTSVVHRFQNNLIRTGGHLCWDIEHLYDELVAGLGRFGYQAFILATAGICGSLFASYLAYRFIFKKGGKDER